jgi:hypothetical protein
MRRVATVLVIVLVGAGVPVAWGLARAPAAVQAAPVRSLQADFDTDGADDFAVGVPGEDTAGRVDAGALSAVDGVAGGLSVTGAQLFTQDTFGVAGGAETGDFFGGAVAVGDSGPAAAAAAARTGGVVR